MVKKRDLNRSTRPVTYGTVIDLKEHLVGRTAAVIAKALLEGHIITATRTEQLNLAGPELRNKKKFLDFLRKKHLTNPKKGPFHFRSPRMMFRRVVRGMLPKDKRGQEALSRLKVFEGIPKFLLTEGRRVCAPGCLRPTRYAPHRKYTKLGNVCKEVGWNHRSVVEKYENKRIAASTEWFADRMTKERSQKEREAAAQKAMSAEDVALLRKFGSA